MPGIDLGFSINDILVQVHVCIITALLEQCGNVSPHGG